MLKNKRKIMMTGGHAHATAYALIKYLNQTKKNWEIVWIGPLSHIEGIKVESLENRVFPKMGVTVFNINAGRLQRKLTRWTLLSLLKIPVGFFQSFLILLKVKPDIVLSFGGFVGLPVVISSWILKIPVVIHDQTTAAGRANIYSAPFATKIAVSRPESLKYFPGNKTVVTGNPVDSSILEIKHKKSISIPPVLFITGGHTGSKTVNENIIGIINTLLKDFYVIHQTGEPDYEKIVKLREEFKTDLKKRYEVYPTIASGLWPEILEKSDIVVSRAGANSVSQIMIVKRPAIFIPITFSYQNEQLKNARMAQKFGIAEILEEKDLNPGSLLDKIYSVRKNWYKYIGKTNNKSSPDLNASQKIADILEKNI